MMLRKMMMIFVVMGMGLALLAGCGASEEPVDGDIQEQNGGNSGSLLDPVPEVNVDGDTDDGNEAEEEADDAPAAE